MLHFFFNSLFYPLFLPPSSISQHVSTLNQKREAIALCKRKIEAAINLYGDGRITREEYLRRVEYNEREITHWESRTSESEKTALELAMCMDAVDKLSKLWDLGDAEDKQGMARSLFSYVVFDLDTRRIVDFRLKPWADRFLTLRSAILGPNASIEAGDLGSMTGSEPMSRDMHPEGYETISRDSLFRIVERVLVAFYHNRPLPQKPASSLIPEKQSRNLEIVQRFLAGERAVDLAQEFGISVRRVNRLVRRYQRREGSV